MKRILKSLFTVIVLVVLVAGATRAVWHDPAEIRNNKFISGNAESDLWDSATSSYKDNINSFTFDDIYPKWTKDFAFKMKNNSESAIILDIRAELSELWSNYNPLRNEVMLQFSWTGGQTGWASLKWWKDNSASLGSLNQGEARWYTAHFKMNDVGNAFEKKTITFKVLFTGTQQ